MKKRNLIMVVLAIITMGLAIPLSAQSSNQLTATAGVFGTDVDDYMDVNYYGDVEFDKWFGLLGKGIQLGYATKFGDIYLGGYYTGNILTTGTNETKRLRTYWDTTLQQLTSKVDDTIYDQTTTETNNHIAALVGVANIGIKLGFYENITTYNTPYNVGRRDTSTVTHNADGSITYSNNDSINYEQSNGNLVPYLQAGTKLTVGSYIVAPRVSASVNFSRDKLIDEYYGSARTSYQGNFVGDERIERRGRDYGYTTLDFGGGADFWLDDSMYAALDYFLSMDLYNQSFSAAGKSVSVKGTLDWNNGNNYSTTQNYFDRTEKGDYASVSVSEKSYTSHTIIPAFWKEKKLGDDLKLGVSVRVPVIISSRSTSSYDDEWSITQRTYKDENLSSDNRTEVNESHTAGDKTEYSYLGIFPSVGIGASYNLIPGRFTVNAGVNLYPIAYKKETTVTSRNGVNSTYNKVEMGSGSNKYTSSETATVTAPASVRDSVQNETSWTGLSGSLGGGFVFCFNDNFALDMALASSYDPGFNINLTTLNVLFSVKF